MWRRFATGGRPERVVRLASPPQRSMHLCAAECFRKHVEAADATLDNCQKTCAGPIERAQATVSDEMKRIQARLQREVAGCEDDARMDAAVTAASSDMARQSAMEAAFAPCAAAAARATTRRLHDVVVPSLEKQLKSLAAQADR